MCRQQFDRPGMKFMIVVLATLYIIAGLVMLGFGISIKATPDNFQSHYDYSGLDLRIIRGDILQKSAVFMIVMAFLSITSGFFVMYAVIWEKPDLLKISSIILAVLIFINIILIIFTAAYPSKNTMKEEMKVTFLKDFGTQDVKTNRSIITSLPQDLEPLAWAKTQINTKCCGIDGPEDYSKYIPALNRTEKFPNNANESMVLPVPLSCCKLSGDVKELKFANFDGCVGNDTSATNQLGCFNSLMVYYQLAALTVYRLAPILMAFEIGLIAFQLKLAYDLNTYQSME